MSEFDHIKVFVIGSNKAINVYPKVPVKENKVIIQKDVYEPTFKPENIFYLKSFSKIPLLNKLKKREPCLLYVLGKGSCEQLSISNPQDIEKANLFRPFTLNEEKEIVNKYIARLLRTFKPISTLGLVIIIILLVINLILTIMGLAGVHIR